MPTFSETNDFSHFFFLLFYFMKLKTTLKKRRVKAAIIHEGKTEYSTLGNRPEFKNRKTGLFDFQVDQ